MHIRLAFVVFVKYQNDAKFVRAGALLLQAQLLLLRLVALFAMPFLLVSLVAISSPPFPLISNIHNFLIIKKS